MQRENYIKELISKEDRHTLIKECNKQILEEEKPLECKNLMLKIAENYYHQGDVRQVKLICDILLVAFPRDIGIIELVKKIYTSGYSSHFYDDIHPAGRRVSKAYLEYLMTYYHPQSMIDIGAATGQWLLSARELGLTDVVGVDFPVFEEKNKISDQIKIIKHNLNNKFTYHKKFDLAVNIEVAEHLLPERSESFILDLCNLSEIIIFAAALPRQSGDFHINCRPHSFWINLFEKNNFDCIDLFRPHFWYSPEIDANFIQNTFLFVNKHSNHLKRFPKPQLYDVYHPLNMNNPYIAHDHGG